MRYITIIDSDTIQCFTQGQSNAKRVGIESSQLFYSCTVRTIGQSPSSASSNFSRFVVLPVTPSQKCKHSPSVSCEISSLTTWKNLARLSVCFVFYFFPPLCARDIEKPPLSSKTPSPSLFLPHLDVAVEEITTLLSKALTSGTDDTIVLTEILNTMSHLCDGDSSEYRQAST